MRLLYLAILAGSLAGCGKGYNGRGWPQEVDGIVRSFYHLHDTIGGAYVEPPEYLTIELRDTSHAGTNVVGYCENREDEGYIALDPEFWNAITPSTRQTLLYHELGHCAAWMDHRGTILNGRPTSLMYPYVVSGYHYDQDRDYYDRELLLTVPTRVAGMHHCTLTLDENQDIVAR